MKPARIISILLIIVVMCAVATAGVSKNPPARTGNTSPARLLLKNVERVSFSKMPLLRVLEYYSKITGLDFKADWAALRDVGITATTPVTLKVRKIRFDRLLDLTLNSIAPKRHPLAWRVSGKAVIISTQMRILLRNRLRLIPSAPARIPKGRLRKRPSVVPRKKVIKRLDFSDISLKDAIDFLRDVSGANIHVNWRALKTIGITRDTKVNLKARDISVARALTLITDQLSVGQDKYSSVYWVVDEGVVEISTGEALNHSTRVEVYDITDLLLVVPNFIAPSIDLSRTTVGNNANNNASIWGNNTGNNNTSNGDIEGPGIAEQRQKMRDELVEIIKLSIGEEMWAPEGKGSARILGNKLIISQTPLGFKLLERAFRR